MARTPSGGEGRRAAVMIGRFYNVERRAGEGKGLLLRTETSGELLQARFT